MQVYIDTDNGSWGVAERNLVILDLDPEQVEELYDMSDNQRVALAAGALREQEAVDEDR